MFNWEDTVIINNLTDLGYAGVTAADGATDIVKHPRFWVDKTDATNPVLRISHSLRIAKSNVKFIYKRAWEVPEYAQIKFDMSTAITALGTEKSGVERLNWAYEVIGSNDVIYVDAYSRHKVPFTVEFPVSSDESAADLAAKVVKMIKKYRIALKGTKIFDASVDGNNVVITAKDEYLKVAKASLEYYNEKASTYDCCTSFGDYEESAPGLVVTDGKPGNGTYRQLVKDLWLPTDAHRAWETPFDDEAPMPGAHYNEYTITMCVERPGLGGLSAVGQVIASETMHTFYVLDNGATDETNPSKAFETALKAIADVTTTGGENPTTTYNNVKTADKDYDDKTVDDATLEAATTGTKVVEAEGTAQGTNKTDTEGLTDPKGLTEGKRQPAA
jgi:hypothetical protein